MKLVIISICKDEAATIGQVLDGVPAKIQGITDVEKWVIDDGSLDATADVAKDHGAKVISDGHNKGLAFRFREALELALARKADVLVNIDGDMQFDPKEIPDLVRPIVAGEADFVAADRFTDAESGRARRPDNMSMGKYLGNKVGAKVVSKLSNHQFNDVTCGFRAYSKRAIVALNTDGTYTYTHESFQVLAMKRLRIKALPVSVKYYSQRKSKVVKSILHFVAVGGISIMRSYRDFAPLRFFGWLGLIPFTLGVIALVIFFFHWITTGSPSPLKFLGFAGVYFFTFGIIFWSLGLVADMLSRMLNNQEKILERVKRLEYSHLKEDPEKLPK